MTGVLKALLRKEYLQIFRDKLMLRQLILMPFIQLLLLSSAATFEVKTANVYLVDQDHSTASRGLVDHLRASGRFAIVGASPSLNLADRAILSRDAGVILVVPQGFESDIVRTRTGKVQLIFNAEDGALAGVTNSYAQQIIAAYASDLGVSLRPMVASTPSIDIHTRGWYNQELDYKDYMIPGILVQILTLIGTLLTAMNIVREKELGTLDQLNVTPIPRSAFIAAKLIPLWTIALVELTIGLLVARFLFDVPIRGSLTLVFFTASVYLVVALGIGLWVSTLVDTQQQAMFISFFLMLVYLLMSGLFTPVRSMPAWAQWMAEVNPVKHIILILRAVMLKGAGIADIVRPLTILSGTGVLVLTLAVRQYAKTSR
ncbi:MAG TPA: ABC transporter permease [Gemmatimonadaceae bacterium]|nr:ABC transporter permease [Gemmatimonadaceae bacterium]